MKPAFSRAVVALLSLALTVSVAPISRSQNTKSYNLAAIHFNGLERYTQQQGIAASGLHIGKQTTVGDLQEPAERMSKSGTFDSVSFQYSNRGDDLTAVFGVTETKDVFSCVFDNFVWFSDADIDQLLRKRVTFYSGTAPERGDTVQQVQSALTDYLVANGIPATVSSIPAGHTFIFHADGVSIPVKTVSYPGRAQVPQSDLDHAPAQILNQEYARTLVNAFATAGLGAVYSRYGYLRTKFGEPAVTLINPASKGAVTPVAVTIPITEGDLYHWSGVTWTGNQAIASDALTATLGMQPNEVANLEKVETGFFAVSQAYKRKGYLAVHLDPQRSLDDTSKLVNYFVAIDESKQFHMGQVFFEGVSPEAAVALAKAWTLKPGVLFDVTYPDTFAKTTAAQILLPFGIKKGNPNFRADLDMAAAVANVHIKVQ